MRLCTLSHRQPCFGSPALRKLPEMTAFDKPKLATDADRMIGSRIAALRAAQGLSQTALGNAIGVSFQQIQKYEKGRNRIGAGRLQTIADLLNVSVETFFARPPGNDEDGATAPTFFDDPKVMELVLAFNSIADETTRNSVLSIVKAAASLRQGRSEVHNS